MLLLINHVNLPYIARSFLSQIDDTLELKALPKKEILRQVRSNSVTEYLMANKKASILIALGLVILLTALGILVIKLTL